MVRGITQVVRANRIHDADAETWKEFRQLANQIRTEASQLRELFETPSSRQPPSTFEPSKEVLLRRGFLSGRPVVVFIRHVVAGPCHYGLVSARPLKLQI